jgi:hypothetical protein
MTTPNRYSPTDKRRNRLLAEAVKRGTRVSNLDWEKLMFGPQRDFINDPSRLKVACCSRRAGKSHGVALALLKAGFENEGSFPLYINMNRASAKGIIWPALKAIDKALGLGLRFDNTHGHIHLPNGSAIMIYGAGSKREMDKMRGLAPPAICLDEAQNMGNDMLYLLTQVLLPATFDYKAPIMVTGTPSNSRHNPFYKICHGQQLDGKTNIGWSVHGWTMIENPYIPDAEEQRQEMRENLGWNLNTPAYLRELCGKWIFDTDRVIFNKREDMLVDRFPLEEADDWRYILGCDLGTVDPCAYGSLAYSRSVGKCYVLECYREADLSTIEAGTEIERLYDRHPPFSHTIVDSGGQGAAFIRQWKDTHPSIPARPVEKGKDSVDMGISIINADIRAGKLFFVESKCQDLLMEMDTLQWDERAMDVGKRSVKAGLSDHAVDAFRYAYTKVRTHDTNAMVVDTSTKAGSAEWWERKREKARKQAFRPKKEEPHWVKMGKWKRPGRR